ncbi:MmgE/PrpD family protein [Chloroflexota bacterium]
MPNSTFKDTDKSFSEIFSNFTASLRFEHLPGEVVESAKLIFLDAIGLALVCSDMDFARGVIETVKALGGCPESVIIGKGDKVPASNAGLANGTMVRGVELDDTHMSSHIHVSSFVIPTALAVGEATGESGKSVITAAVAGYEVASRMGTAGEKMISQGLHCTGIWGPFGAATVAGKLMGLSTEEITMALGIAGSQAAGILQAQPEGAWTTRLQSGWASHSGILAGQLAKQGFIGPRQVLEGKFGLYNALLGPGNFNLGMLTQGLGKFWETMQTSFKFFSAGHGIHFYLSSALHLKQKHAIQPDDIEEVKCLVTPVRASLHFEPGEARYTPSNPHMARFSLPYTIAIVLLEGNVGLEAYSQEKLKDFKLLELAQKVTYAIDPEAEMQGKQGHIIIRTKDGKVYEWIEEALRGTPDNPASKEDVESKFRINTRKILTAAKAESIINTVNNLEKQNNLSKLMGLLS